MLSIYRKSLAVIFLFIVSLFMLSACDGGGSDTSDPAQDQEPQTVSPTSNRALMGAIGEAQVDVFALDDLSTPVTSTTTSYSSDFDDIGHFSFSESELPKDPGWYLIKVSKGKDWDANYDSLKDGTGTLLEGGILCDCLK